MALHIFLLSVNNFLRIVAEWFPFCIFHGFEFIVFLLLEWWSSKAREPVYPDIYHTNSEVGEERDSCFSKMHWCESEFWNLNSVHRFHFLCWRPLNYTSFYSYNVSYSIHNCFCNFWIYITSMYWFLLRQKYLIWIPSEISSWTLSLSLLELQRCDG